MSKWYEIKIEPRDVLFFRGAKPMGASTIGAGANWPMPSIFHQALLSAFHATWPERLAGIEHSHNNGVACERDANKSSSFRFGGLKTVGIFPEVAGELYFPMPSDVQCLDNEGKQLCILKPGEVEGSSDMPSPLTKGLFKDGEATKQKPAKWVSETDLKRYLNGESLTASDEKVKLFDVESRPGIGIDPETHATEDGKFYISETMRLRNNVSLRAFATCDQVRHKDNNGPVDLMARFFDESTSDEFIFGGQRGVARLKKGKQCASLPSGVKLAGNRIKWVTLTPSIFTGGWLPSWIHSETGEILAPTVTTRPERKPGESRQAWRARFETTTIKGTLVAAAIPKPIPYSGWRTSGGNGKTGAKPTRLCVPAGAAYYFEADDPEALIEFLSSKCKSDMYAEKGFGFGLCGVWKEYKEEEN